METDVSRSTPSSELSSSSTRTSSLVAVTHLLIRPDTPYTPSTPSTEWKKGGCARSTVFGSYDKELERIDHPDTPHPDDTTHVRAKGQPPFNYGSGELSAQLII